MQSFRPLFGLRSVSLIVGSAVLAGVALTAGAHGFSPAAATLSTVRINAGGPAVTDVDGSKWVADVDYTGGKIGSTTAYVDNSAKQYVFQDDRYGMSAYRIPVVNGKYDVHLLEAETYFNAVGQRVFNVSAEGKNVAKNVDIYKLAGGKNKSYWLSFTMTVSDGVLDLGFKNIVNYAKVSGIVVRPAASPSPSPSPSATTTTPPPSPSPTASPTPSPSASATLPPGSTTTPPPSPTPSPSATSNPARVLWGMDDNTAFDRMEAAVGRTFAIAREYLRMDQAFVNSREQALVNSGHSLVFSVKSRTGSGPIPFADVTAGKWDNQLLTGMKALNALSTPTFFIFEHEADATAAKASCTSTKDSVCGPEFVAAWTHVWNLAHANNLTHLIFTWTVTAYGFNSQTGVRNNYYWPGTAYTDWLGVDAYNGGCNGTWYGSFHDMMTTTLNWASTHAPSMRIIVPELGATEGSTPDAKANWFNAIPSTLADPAYTNIDAISYWNDAQPTCDFRVNSSTQSFDAYKSVSATPIVSAAPSAY